MCKQDLALNNLLGLIYHKTQPTNQSTKNYKLQANIKSSIFI